MKRFFKFAQSGVFALASLFPAWSADALRFEFVDVEGGQATLIVTPRGESLLIDTGWPGFDGRDANRIVTAAQKYGIKQIDWLVITHFHTDHVGGIKQLVARMPVVNVVDHGPTVETSPQAAALYQDYEEVAKKAKRLTVKPGDRIPVKGVTVEVVAANGELVVRKGTPNPLCAGVEKKAEDKGENARSVGLLITFGKFRFLNLGDLTWNKELELACPENRLGKIDVYLTTHHGMDISGPPALVHALSPKVAIMNNGEKKGGAPASWKVIRTSPGLLDLWQIHFSAAGGAEHNTDERMIANLSGSDPGYSLSMQAYSSGKFTVSNSRNGFSKSY
ncbi:MAG: MBL fold metallo-hydrolase [Bryobacteraceae bacterium]|nr:MBL fold metallo-hydrolase [Bryobacteraceae bacterium]MDW8380093.1 MBL fold metallo-hydrolase [Bryobacterales bacterium]